MQDFGGIFKVSRALFCLGFRVHIPNNWVLGIWAIVITVLILGMYMIMKYLDAQGKVLANAAFEMFTGLISEDGLPLKMSSIYLRIRWYPIQSKIISPFLGGIVFYIKNRTLLGSTTQKILLK